MTDDRLSIERSNVILYCQRWVDTTNFYRDTLRMPIEFANAWLVEFRINPTSFISIADASRTSIRSVDGQGLTMTFRVADAAVARDELLGRGAPVGSIMWRWGSLSFYVDDPEGHRLEFWGKEINPRDLASNARVTARALTAK